MHFFPLQVCLGSSQYARIMSYLKMLNHVHNSGVRHITIGPARRPVGLSRKVHTHVSLEAHSGPPLCAEHETFTMNCSKHQNTATPHQHHPFAEKPPDTHISRASHITLEVRTHVTATLTYKSSVGRKRLNGKYGTYINPREGDGSATHTL